MNSLDLHTNNRTIEINGTVYKMDFDMLALSQAEQVYLTHFGRNVNVSAIMGELSEMKMSAIMAFAYGALVSAGNTITWQKFSKEIFNYTNFDNVFAVVSEAIVAMMTPDDEPNGSGENEKN